MSRESQCKRILDLLLAEAPNEVSLTALMDLRIASLTRRISDLRAQGYRIENRKQVVDGVTHSWYRLEWERFPTIALDVGEFLDASPTGFTGEGGTFLPPSESYCAECGNYHQQTTGSCPRARNESTA